MKKERVIIIDGSSYIFRAYFALPGLSNSKGLPTNAVFGFTNMLMKVLDEKPTKLILAFDPGGKTFRKDLYSEYKANREAAPEDLVEQFPYIFQAVDAFGVKRVTVPEMEADDVIGTLATRAEKDGYEVEIISGDKDLMQLVSDRVTLFDTMKNVRYNREKVFEKFQVYPEQIVDFLALMGDSSDNIPGVPGIGKKTAADLLGQFGSIDKIYESLDEIKQKKRRETLANEKEKAYLSKSLTQIKLDVDIPMTWEEAAYQGPDKEKLQQFLQEMEFHNLIKKFSLDATQTSFKRGEVVNLKSEGELRKALSELELSEVVAVDTETTSLKIHSADLVGISLCGFPSKAYYLPLGHVVPQENPDEAKALQEGQVPADVARKILKPFLEHPQIPKVGQNLKYDTQVLRRWGVELKGMVNDTMLSSYLINADEKHGLDALTLKYLQHQNITYSEVAGKGKSQISFSEVDIEKAADYAAEDAEVTWHLHRVLSRDLKDAELTSLLQEVELPLSQVLAKMEYQGVLVDSEKLQVMSKSLEKAIAASEKKIFKLAGKEFNINSPKQLSEILFTELKLPVVKKTKTGISTDESVLQKLSKEHEICQEILRFRGLGKLRSTYVEGLLGQIHPDTKRIHSSFNQTVAATGRLSSSDPNLQNIPTGGEVEYDIRSVFVPTPGFEMLSADYSQVELRLLADMSGDKELTRAFANDEDVHSFTGKLIFGVDEVTSEQRSIAKTINFGVVYGQTPYGLSQTLGISNTEAKEFIDKYFARYGQVKEFLQSLVDEARETGWTRTKLGRRRQVPEIDSRNRMRREMAERMAINTPIQGTAADMIKIAMIRIDDRMTKEKLSSRMLMQVHDELVFEVTDGEKVAMERLVKEEMEGAMKLSVPLKVDMGWGENWSACK